MNLTYLKDKPYFTKTLWDEMEDLQDKYPHYWLGWNGFVLMVVWV